MARKPRKPAAVPPDVMARALAQSVTPEGAARRVGCTRPSIDAALRRGELTGHPDAEGRGVRLDVVELDAWARGRSFGTPGRPAR